MAISIKVFSSGNIKEGANIVLSYSLFLPSGVIKDNCDYFIQGKVPNLEDVIFIYYYNNYPIASAYCLRYHNEKNFEFHVFVSEQHRRKGIGTNLTLYVKEYMKVKKFTVAPWDRRSRGFYSSFPYQKSLLSRKYRLTFG
jgi:GNAT superfamily N-acetyltransferase